MAFTLLDCPKTVASVDGVHPIALLDEAENYERLQLALCDIAAEVKDLEVLTIDGKTFQVCVHVTCTVYRLISSSVETGSS